VELPQMALVEQEFDPQRIDDITATVAQEMLGLNLQDRVKPGDSIAITGGSRGIAHIDIITRAIVDELKKIGGEPFIFPAMGSHGGATADGQIRILANLGITEETIGCPIKSDMEPAYLGKAALDYPIYVDKNAMDADHIVIVNRIKAHTKFEGPVESGLMKMMAIGMGKQKGASYYHRAAVRLSFQKIVENVGLEVMKKCPILFGLAIVENALHETYIIRGIIPGYILEDEKLLL
jgi:nickel-dependent lactate racemase